MKYIRLFLFMFLGLFIFNLDVEAEGCELKCVYHFNVKGKADIEIYYDGVNDPKITTNVDTSYFAPGSSNKFISLTDISRDVFYSTVDDKLFCPNLFWTYEKFGWLFITTEERYTIYASQLDYNSDEVDDEGILSPAEESIVNVDGCNIENEIVSDNVLTCSYTKDIYEKPVFSFKIKKDEYGNLNFDDIYQDNIYYPKNREQFIFEGFEFKCPPYIDLKDPIMGTKYTIYTITASDVETKTGWYFSDRVYYGDQTTPYLAYVNYYGKNKIRFFKDSDNERGVRLVNNDNQSIDIINLDETNKDNIKYFEIISSDNVENYPRYIIEYVDENKNYTYKFADYSDSNANVNYINLKHIGDLLSTGGSVDETCRSLLGSSFLDFLNNNVLKIIYIGIPILLIVLTTFDFAKVVFIDDKDGVGAAGKKFGKRVIAAFLIYLVPTILIFVSNIFANNEISKCAKTLKDLTETYNS